MFSPMLLPSVLSRRLYSRRFLITFGKLILDATKLCFGSMVLGTIIRGDYPQSTVLIAGITASIVGAFIGIVLIVIYEEK